MNYIKIPTKNLKKIQNEIHQIFLKNYSDKINLFYIKEENSLLNIPSLRSLLSNTNCINYIDSIAFIVLQPNYTTSIHIDAGAANYSFNIPIKNCKNSYVSFYQNIGEIQKHSINDKKYFYRCNPAYCNFVDKIEMNTPYIINVKQPHSVSNKNNNSRIALLIRLTSDFNPHRYLNET